MPVKQLIKISWLTITLSFMVAISFGANTAAGPIRVLSVSPTPNYPFCGNDPGSLTDGKTESYPIWTRKGCVGWQARGVVKVLLEVGQWKEATSGKLLIHTARGTTAGVHMPARIDIYSQRVDGKFGYATGMTIQDKDFADRQNHWISLGLKAVHSHILATIRPNGNYFFIDEIQWEPQNPSPPQAQPVVGDIAACEKNSMERYRQSLLARTTLPEETLKEWIKAFSNKSQVLWEVDNAYAPLPLYPQAKIMGPAPLEIQLYGTRSERESACVGILNLSNTEQAFDISVEGEPQAVSGVGLRKVGKILAADGSQVYDPLLPLDNGHGFTAASREAAYLWIQADFRQIPPGQHDLRIMVRDRDHRVINAIPLKLHISDISLPANLKPKAINWGYTTDLPIWKDPKKALADLVDHGINVFVIHPARIPMPTLTGDWQANIASKLSSDITLYHGKGLIVLYLGWGPGQGPAWLNPLAKQDIPRQKAALQGWLRQLRSFLKGLGLEPKDWALYPVDEPQSQRLPYLGELAKWIKEAAPDVQIYANPLATATYKTTSADLVKLSPSIDFWQPELGFATGPGAPFFAILSRLGRPWWTYAGGPSPAKSGSPWNDYRLLSWRAWAAGAKGVGFWSYSDTSGTSAWDDLDGRRPDFAVVYEGKDGPISSRRWEAFRKGIEDFQLLESVAQGDLPASAKLAPNLKSWVKGLLSQSPVPLAAAEGLRRKILQVPLSKGPTATH
jgi:hypothetical protein